MTQDLSAVSEAEWDEARQALPVIRQLAEAPSRSRADVLAAAAKIGCGPTTAYELLRRYRADPRLTSLLRRRRGPNMGGSRLSSELDALVQATINEVYLTRQKAPVTHLVAEVRRRCKAMGLQAPGRKAVTARVRALAPDRVLAAREGRKAARDRYAPATGSLEAAWPLSLVQIDHTLVDVIVVDSASRTPIQRPWLTLAIDVATRCVAGMHLSLEAPSATSVALCIAHAALPKDAWLGERDIEGAWPVYGLPERLQLDNAKEFRSEALRRGCDQYGIAIDYRPVRTPHYGGHIERLIGTMMGKVHLLPGSTFSDVRAKGDLKPEKTAAMTLDEVERWLGHAIAGVYHRSLHRGVGMTPEAAWRRGVLGDEETLGRGEPTAVADPRRLLIDFLPLERRLVRRDGVALHGIAYWSDVLRTWIGHPEPMIVRYDPRDLSRVYLLGPDGAYYDLGYRDLRRPPITLWEHRLAMKRLRDEGWRDVNEESIFRTVEAMRTITEQAVLASKAARRQMERRLRTVGPRAEPAVATTTMEPEEPLAVPEDRPKPYENMLPVEDW
jgi:putative transposase